MPIIGVCRLSTPRLILVLLHTLYDTPKNILVSCMRVGLVEKPNPRSSFFQYNRSTPYSTTPLRSVNPTPRNGRSSVPNCDAVIFTVPSFKISILVGRSGSVVCFTPLEVTTCIV